MSLRVAQFGEHKFMYQNMNPDLSAEKKNGFSLTEEN
jgi:hypothetical protein